MSWTTWVVVAVVILMVTLVCLFPHVVFFLMGATSPNDWPYLLLSGFVPSTALASVIYPFVNCHVESCLRIGRYHVDGFKVCYRHQPNPEVRKRGVSHEHIKDIYERGNEVLTPSVTIKYEQHHDQDHPGAQRNLVRHPAEAP